MYVSDLILLQRNQGDWSTGGGLLQQEQGVWLLMPLLSTFQHRVCALPLVKTSWTHVC